MATFDVEARLDIKQTAIKKQLYGQLEEEQSVDEVVAYEVYVVPNAASDTQIPLGSVGTASTLYVKNSHGTDSIQIKLNDSANTAITITAGGWILFRLTTITAIYVTVPGSNDINLTLVATE